MLCKVIQFLYFTCTDIYLNIFNDDNRYVLASHVTSTVYMFSYHNNSLWNSGKFYIAKLISKVIRSHEFFSSQFIFSIFTFHLQWFIWKIGHLKACFKNIRTCYFLSNTFYMVGLYGPLCLITDSEAIKQELMEAES